MRARRVIVWALVALALSPSCKPRAGRSCEIGKDSCLDNKTALKCGKDSKYQEVACSGPIGCLKLGATVTCDITQAEEGAPCLATAEGDLACTKQKNAAVICKDGVYQRDQECRGAKGCSMIGKMLTCDSTLANKGDTCKKSETYACSVDGKEKYVCRGGKYDLWRFCRGKEACQVRAYSSEAFCDNTLSEIGDPCGSMNAVACSADGQNELICRGGRYETLRDCKKQPCAIVGSRRVECN